MRCALLLICAGIASGAFVREVDSALGLTLAAIPWLILLLLAAKLCNLLPAIRRIALCILFFLLGLCWHLQWASTVLAERLPHDLEGETLRLKGVVIGLPESSSIAQQFQFKVLESSTGFYPRKVILNYYGDRSIAPGQYWEFSVRLNRPHGFSNPGGFDYEGWLFQKRVSARGYVRQSPPAQLIPGASLKLDVPWLDLLAVELHSVRYAVKLKLERLLGDARYSGLLLALLLGDRTAISQDNWSLFSATGSNHLFVISGLHIGMISGASFWLALLIGKALKIGTFAPAQKVAALVALSIAFIYALLAGFSLPTQRAFIMIAVLICGLFWQTRYLISFRLLLALLAVLLINPLAIINGGFWLSFTAVTALLSFSRIGSSTAYAQQEELSSRKRTVFVLNFIQPQLVVFIALAVPLLFFTQQLSLLSPLANIVAIPVVGFFVVPVCFVALLVSFVHESLATFLLGVAHGTVSWLISFLEFLVEQGAGVLQLHLSEPDAWQLLAMMFTVLLLLLPKAVCRKSLILPLLLSILPLPLSVRHQLAEEGFLKLHVLDVGQGLAVIVETRNRVLLYDTGANLSPDFNMGSAVVVPALRSLGLTKVDVLVVSHSDNDHAGGLSGVHSNIPIARLISNKERFGRDAQADICRDGMAWTWDAVEFQFLQGSVNFPEESFAEENNNSCVLRIKYGEVQILLPGDIERTAERELVSRYGKGLASKVLLAPHHGSRSSSSYALLKQVEPEVVVFSAGYRNSFGHPHEQVLARYKEFGAMPLSTADSGMISFEFGNIEQTGDDMVEVAEYRKQNSRYWH